MRLLPSTSRRRIQILLATALVAATAAVAGPAVAAHAQQDCTGSSCNGLNSNTAGCVSDAVSRSAPQTFSDTAAGEQLAIQLRGSPSCESRWARVWAFNSSGSQWLPPSGLQFTIYSDNASGHVVYSQTATVGSRGWESNPYWTGPMVSGVGLYSRACFPSRVCTSWWPSPPPNPQGGSSVAVPNPTWSGYAVTGGTYTEVGAYWTVPAAEGSGNRQMATWVGLGGVLGHGVLPGCCVEQTGTASDTVNGKPVYKAFYQIAPSPAVFLGPVKPVHAGDLMEGIVSSRGDTYTITLYDWGTHSRMLWFKQWKITDSGLDNTSAEAITEDPTLYTGYLATLTRFGAAKFSEVFFNSEPATDYKPTVFTLTGGKVSVSGLNTATDGFSVTYNHS